MKKKKEISGLDKALIFVAIIVVLFTISMIVTYWFFQDIPNVLVTAVFGATFTECGFCSYIWKHKNDSLNASETEVVKYDLSNVNETENKEEKENDYDGCTNNDEIN